MTGLRHSCGRALPDQPRIVRWQGHQALQADCSSCRTTTRVRWDRRGAVAVPVTETVAWEARR